MKLILVPCLVLALAALNGCSKGACEDPSGDFCMNEVKSMECSQKFAANKSCQDLGYKFCKSTGQSTCRKKPGS